MDDPHPEGGFQIDWSELHAAIKADLSQIDWSHRFDWPLSMTKGFHPPGCTLFDPPEDDDVG